MLQKLYEEFPQRLAVVGISHDPRGMPAIHEYTSSHGVSFPVVLGDMNVAVNYLGITPDRPNFSVPIFFFVGPQGELVEEHNPNRAIDRDWFNNTEANLEATVRRLLPPEKTPAKARKGARKAGVRRPAAKS